MHALGCCSSAALHFKKKSNSIYCIYVVKHATSAMPSPAPGVKSARSGTLYNVRRFWDLESIPGGAALYLSHVRLLTGAASQRARPVWTPKSALPGAGGAKDSVRTWDPRFPSAPLPPRGAGLQAGERAQLHKRRRSSDRYRKQA